MSGCSGSIVRHAGIEPPHGTQFNHLVSAHKFTTRTSRNYPGARRVISMLPSLSVARGTLDFNSFLICTTFALGKTRECAESRVP